MTDIATLTVNPAVDISTSVERMVPDDKLRADRVRREPGGGGVNVARAVANLGGEAVAIHTRGGPSGDALTELLADQVPTEAVDIAEATRENVSVTESSTSHQYRLVMPGPEVGEDEWDACLDAINGLDPQPTWLVASGSLPSGLADDTYAQLAEHCRTRDLKLILDTSGPPLVEACEVGVYLIKPNLGELARLVDRELRSDEDIAEAVDGLLDRGAAEVVVVSMGAGGAYLAGPDIEGQQMRAPTVHIASKVGAGDSMVGGIVLALSRGESVVDATRFGVAAGAAAVMTEGSGLCRRDDAERLFQQMS